MCVYIHYVPSCSCMDDGCRALFMFVTEVSEGLSEQKGKRKVLKKPALFSCNWKKRWQRWFNFLLGKEMCLYTVHVVHRSILFQSAQVIGASAYKWPSQRLYVFVTDGNCTYCQSEWAEGEVKVLIQATLGNCSNNIKRIHFDVIEEKTQIRTFISFTSAVRTGFGTYDWKYV